MTTSPSTAVLLIGRVYCTLMVVHHKMMTTREARASRLHTRQQENLSLSQTHSTQNNITHIYTEHLTKCIQMHTIKMALIECQNDHTHSVCLLQLLAPHLDAPPVSRVAGEPPTHANNTHRQRVTQISTPLTSISYIVFISSCFLQQDSSYRNFLNINHS